ncbi:MAG: GNAT family N-acetyltransferase [Paracoccaceae bacterium]|nr:GNAT family N-acetyltransferase [Paracoccaceae bacterium]
MHPVPGGHVAMVVTYLEMTEAAAPKDVPEPEGAEVLPWPAPPLDAYRALQRRIGADWLWASRLRLSDRSLAEVIHAPDVEVWRLMRGADAIGIAELDFRKRGACELQFFGVTPDAIGTTAARLLMNAATARAWARPISRFHLHTCTLDHPNALAFYRRSGFRDYKRAVEVFRDPRLDGTLPPSAAPNIAVLE